MGVPADQRRQWTDEDKHTLRLLYGVRPVAEVAQRLDRTVKQVREAAKRFCYLKKRNRAADHLERIRELHAQGMTTTQIVSELRLPQSTVEFWMRREGLSGNGDWHARVPKTKRRQRQMGKWIADNQRYVWWCVRRCFPRVEDQEGKQIVGTMTLEDVFQECICEIIRCSPTYRRARTRNPTCKANRLTHWILMVTRRAIYKLHRGNHTQKRDTRRLRHLSLESLAQVLGREDPHAPGGDLAMLRECLEQLPDEEQFVLEQMVLEGRNSHSVGEEMGLHHCTVLCRRRDALKRLRAMFLCEGDST